MLPKIFLHKINIRHVTYLISPQINDHLSINCNTFDIVIWCNNVPALVVLIGRLMRRVKSIVPSCVRYIQDIHVKKIAWSSHSSWPVDCPKLSCLLLLPWCTAIAGCHTSSDNSNSQQQPMADYRQISKSLLGASWLRRVKTATNGIYAWKFKYANTIPTVLSMSNGLICGYITGTHDKRIFTYCVKWNLLQLIRILQLLSSILSTYYFAIIYVANNSQVTLIGQRHIHQNQ